MSIFFSSLSVKIEFSLATPSPLNKTKELMVEDAFSSLQVNLGKKLFN